MNSIHLLSILVVLAAMWLGACDIPSDYIVELDIGDIRVGIDDETLEAVNDINAAIRAFNRKEFEIGFQTRQQIEAVRTLIERVALNPENTELFKRLVLALDDGLKVGLDAPTQSILEQFIEVIQNQPGSWRKELTLLLKALEVTGGDLASAISEEISGLFTQMTNDVEGISAVYGREFRCTMAMGGETVKQTVDEAAGLLVARLLPFYKVDAPSKLITPREPHICNILPDELQLVMRDGVLVADNSSDNVDISGFNFSPSSMPKVTVTDENGKVYPEIAVMPVLETTYKLALNLQGIDFSSVNLRSRIVLDWTDSYPGHVYEKTLFIEAPPPPTVDFRCDAQVGVVPFTTKFYDLSKGQPDTWNWNFGDNRGTESYSDSRDADHTFIAPGVYTVTLTVRNSWSEPVSLQKQNFITAYLPYGPEVAFEATPRWGKDQVTVQFTDMSQGSGLEAWLWDFGDGHTSTESNPSHHYEMPGTYDVSLRVIDRYNQSGYLVKEGYIEVPPTSAPVADAGPDQTVVDEDLDGLVTVQLNGSGSHGTDGEITSIRWTDQAGGSIGDAYVVEVTLGIGEHIFLLTVEDSNGKTDQRPSKVTVKSPPYAMAGPDQHRVIGPGESETDVQLNGSGSHDPDGAVVRYEWHIDGQAGAVTDLPDFEVKLGRGNHSITLIVTDNEGLSSTDDFNVVVDVAPRPNPCYQPPETPYLDWYRDRYFQKFMATKWLDVNRLGVCHDLSHEDDMESFEFFAFPGWKLELHKDQGCRGGYATATFPTDPTVNAVICPAIGPRGPTECQPAGSFSFSHEGFDLRNEVSAYRYTCEPPSIRSSENRCIEIQAGSIFAGTVVQVSGCNHAYHQLWRMVGERTASFNIVSLHSGMCLDIGDNTANGSSVFQNDCSGGPSQRWKDELIIFPGGAVVGSHLINESSGRCLDTDGTNLVQRDCSRVMSQAWRYPAW